MKLSLITFLWSGIVFAQLWSPCLSAEVKVLFLGDQKKHRPELRYAILKSALENHGIALTYLEDIKGLSEEVLKPYDGLLVYANIDSIEEGPAQAIINFVEQGGGFVPVHCASYCFRNSPELIAVTGAQFLRHGTGDMTTQLGDDEHEILKGYQPFTSWDETYLHHKHNEENRLVLEYRTGQPQTEGNDREPWTWVRTQGKGRVFYTAWGHDERTWNQPGFQYLMERGIRWACQAKQREEDIPKRVQSSRSEFEIPEMTSLPKDLKPFEYVDVGPKIPNYAAGRGKTLNLMQQPVSATESMLHQVTPVGFHVELYADESMFEGKVISMNWDHLGRLWVCETIDYPNELAPKNHGRDQIRILSDTDGDNKADLAVKFCDGLSIPTAITFFRGGAIVQNGTQTLYLKDHNGDDVCDERTVLISEWALNDTHGGVSNLRYGLDNWFYGMQGYNTSSPMIEGTRQQSFRMGFFRFQLTNTDPPRVSKLEFLRSTTNNTWGIGLSEEGLLFGSTANRAPSFFMPIANRYYERVKGWSPETLSMISDTHLFHPITEKVRQVDHHGGYTAAAGHALYTARQYPKSWWNRTAFVCGPTGKLVGTFVLSADGAGFRSTNPFNLLASNDEWTAPIMAEVGPDGNVWVLDWYNYIVQHNPTPEGFQTGKGAAYETDLRDKKFGRVYRVVYDQETQPSQIVSLNAEDVESLVAQLSSPTMFVRLSAQRLLVERHHRDIVPALHALVRDTQTDEIGLHPGAMHALQVLAGLGEFSSAERDSFDVLVEALSHPSAGVRLNALRVLPDSSRCIEAISKSRLLDDPEPQVVLATLLALSDQSSKTAATLVCQAVHDQRLCADRWLNDAAVSAASIHAAHFLPEFLLSGDDPLSPEQEKILTRACEHLARLRPEAATIEPILLALNQVDSSH